MLTDAKIKTAKPGDKPFRTFDGGGLYLEITPTGGKLWRLKYRFGGKEKRLAIGTYPDTLLAKARMQRDEARRLLADGIDPSENRKIQNEPPRDSRRLHFLRGWSHEHIEQVFPRGSGAGGADGL
jgi:hypothetical protein